MSSFYSSSGGGGGGSSSIPEYTTDPVSPAAGTPWVLRTVLKGTPIGMLLSLTYTADLYQLSYQTSEGIVVRTVLS